VKKAQAAAKAEKDGTRKAMLDEASKELEASRKREEKALKELKASRAAAEREEKELKHRKADAEAREARLNKEKAAVERAKRQAKQREEKARKDAESAQKLRERREQEEREAKARAAAATAAATKARQKARARAERDAHAAEAKARAADAEAARKKQQKLANARRELEKKADLTPTQAAAMLASYLRKKGSNWGWKGGRSEVVRRAQRLMGMPVAEQDGIVGPKTRAAVASYGARVPPALMRSVGPGKPARQVPMNPEPAPGAPKGADIDEQLARAVLQALPPFDNIPIADWVDAKGDFGRRALMVVNSPGYLRGDPVVMQSR
jgi:hypothetical protein